VSKQAWAHRDRRLLIATNLIYVKMNTSGTVTPCCHENKSHALCLLLSTERARVTDVAAPFPMSVNAVSRHVKVLERAGLVRRAREGREHTLQLYARPAARHRAVGARLRTIPKRAAERARSVLHEQLSRGPHSGWRSRYRYRSEFLVPIVVV
jgi:DNA-binding transcriptional ArsR family regulator